MLFVGIDQHKRHLTICVRNEQGEIVLRRQVSTAWAAIEKFLASLQERSTPHGGYVAILEVCGFNGWLVDHLGRWGCHRSYVISAPPAIRTKTDRRDAARLSELLWINRDRLASGQRLVHVRVVYMPNEEEQYDRQLTHLRYRLGRALTRSKNSMQGILRRHNLEQGCPTKGAFTRAAMKWLRSVELPALDRVELNIRLLEYDLHSGQIVSVQAEIEARAKANDQVPLLRSLGRMGAYTALALTAHIGPIERFPTARSLSYYFGLTPGCRNSGASARPGGITQAGHPLVRFLLSQLVLHSLRTDAGLRMWYRRVKRRRGSKIARVAVMRRLCESIWHILSKREPYRPVGSSVEGVNDQGSRSAA